MQHKTVFGVGGHKHKVDEFHRVVRKVKRSMF